MLVCVCVYACVGQRDSVGNCFRLQEIRIDVVTKQT